MKLKVFDEKKAEEEKEVYFKLGSEGNTVVLFAVDAVGNPVPCGNILEITSSGVGLRGSVNRAIGLPLDSKGSVIVKK